MKRLTEKPIRMKKSLFSFVFFASVSVAFGQKTENQNRKFELIWYPSLCNYNFNEYFYQEMKRSYSSSILDAGPNKFDNYFQNQTFGENERTPYLNLGIGRKVSLLTSEKFQSTFRGNLSYAHKIGFEGTGNQIHHEYYDTIVVDGGFMRREKVTIDTWQAKIKGKQINLQFDFISRFQASNIVSLYAGIGGGMSAFVDTYVLASHDTKQFLDIIEPSIPNLAFGSLYDYENIDSNYEIEKRINNIKGDNSISTLVYVPFGVDFVLGNSGSSEKRNHIFVEGQFGLRFNDAFIGNSGVYFHRRYGLGYRFVF